VFVTYEKLSEENGLDDVREANVRRARGDGLDMLCVFPKGSDGARQANIQSGGGVMMYWQLHGGVDGGNLL
jgi:hypothetical protein